MGERGPIGRAQGHRKGLRPLPSQIRPETPPPPDGLSKTGVAEWAEFWASDVAYAIRPADLSLLRTYFRFLDLQRRVLRSLGRNLFVAGSQGQPVISPAAGELHRISADLREMERRLGIGPSPRARLAVEGGEVRQTLEEINRRAGAHENDDTDPRLAALVEDHSEP